LQLLKERSWFDVPLVYANQRRAIIAFEKGALDEAFAAWGEDYSPSASAPSATNEAAQATKETAEALKKALAYPSADSAPVASSNALSKEPMTPAARLRAVGE
jgi:hypothetical protein